MKHFWIVVLPALLTVSGCAAIAVVDATVGVVTTTAKATAKIAGAAASTMIPEDHQKD